MTQFGSGGKRLTGVLAPAISAFDTWQGALASDPFVANLRAHLDAGMAGVVVGGSVGEAVLLTEEERARLVSLARDTVPADRWMVMGTGAESTSLTIQRTQAACQRGADAVLVLPPHYYGAAMSREAMANHYWHVVDESRCPVILYNSPRHTHLTIEPELVHALAAHENVIGIKDSSGDITRLGRFIEAQSPTFSVLNAHGPTFLEALRLGARVGVLAAALYAPRIALAVYDAEVRGDDSAATSAQALLTDVSERVAGALGPAGIKAALDAVGLYGGPVRGPLVSLGPTEMAAVVAALRAAGLLRAA
jgi:4-hydroxy-2-oxoglutarate aldolase